MKNKITVLTLYAVLLALNFPSWAQQPAKVPRIGYLIGTSLSINAARIEAFQRGLRELGYVEGKNIVIEWRIAEGKRDRGPALAAELVSLKVDVIVSDSATMTRNAKEATSTIPIVMTNDGDPVGQGSSPAWRVRAGTLLDCQPFPRSSAENDSSF
jgi:putative tryptophan/tyrosine transport system substrate-binding protein